MDPALPNLSLHATTAPEELTAALKLISDSVAQQRQTLNKSIFLHPLTLPLYISFLAVLAYRAHDTAMTLLSLVGITIATMSLVARATEDYLRRAEVVGSRQGYDEFVAAREDRVVVVAQWGTEIIGVVTMELEQDALLTAWTVRLKYRRRGLGKDLLEKAVEIARQRLGRECIVKFADGHANSYRLPRIPAMFQSAFDKQEVQAREVLADVLRP